MARPSGRQAARRKKDAEKCDPLLVTHGVPPWGRLMGVIQTKKRKDQSQEGLIEQGQGDTGP